MSFSAMACYQTDKNSFGTQSYDDLGADFFDQFLTYSPVDTDGPDYPALPQSTCLESSSSDHHSGGASSSSLDSDAKIWQSWTVPQTSSEDLQFYSESTGRAAISDSELLTLEAITLKSPNLDVYTHPSLPCSPSPAAAALPRRRRNRIVHCLSKKMKKAASNRETNLRSPIRKSTSSPKMRNHSQTDLWGQKLEASKFVFDFEEDLPLSPPPSAKVLRSSRNIKLENGEHTKLYGFNNELLQHFGNDAYETPLSTPILDSEDSRRTSSQQRTSDSMHFPSTPKMDMGSNRWSQIPGSTDFNAYESPSAYPPENNPPLWWNHAATAPMAQPSPTALLTNPQRASKTLAMQLQNDISYRANERAYISPNMGSGLMIQKPGPSTQQSFVVQSSPRQHQHHHQDYFSPSQPQFHARSHQHAPAPNHHHQQSRLTRKNRSISSDSDSPSPKSSPTFHVRKRKNAKNGKHSTPRTPTLGGEIDFVNYTPSDSRKILTGVAPSGSSKTKARREKEAMDKRRKLSQAAVRAVREAGGDVDSLVEQGLFV